MVSIFQLGQEKQTIADKVETLTVNVKRLLETPHHLFSAHLDTYQLTKEEQ